MDIVVDAYWGALLPLSIVIVLLYVWLARYRQAAIRAYGAETVASFPSRSYRHFFIKVLCFAIVWALLSFALMRPRIPTEGVTAQSSSKNGLSSQPLVDEVLFVLDVSRSMTAEDGTGVSRFDRSKELISVLLDQFGGIPAGLYAFAGTCELIVPPTLDFLYFRIYLDDTKINDTRVSGTNILDAIDAVGRESTNDPFRQRVAVILLSDGEDSGLVEVTHDEMEARKKHILDAVKRYSSAQLSWYTIGFGSTQGSPIPDFQYQGRTIITSQHAALMQQIASIGHGKYFNQSSYTPDLLAAMISSALFEASFENQPVAQIPITSWNDFGASFIELYYVPLIAAVILIIVAFALPELDMRSKKAALFLLLCILQQNLCGAHEEYEVWLAGQYAIAKRYDLASSILSTLQNKNFGQERDVILYDLGTAYLNEGLLDKALRAYQQIDMSAVEDLSLKQAFAINDIQLCLALAQRELHTERLDSAEHKKIVSLLEQAKQRIVLLKATGVYTGLYTQINPKIGYIPKSLSSFFNRRYAEGVPAEQLVQFFQEKLFLTYRELGKRTEQERLQELPTAEFFDAFGAFFQKQADAVTHIMHARGSAQTKQVYINALTAHAKEQLQLYEPFMKGKSPLPKKLYELFFSEFEKAIDVHNVNELLFLKAVVMAMKSDSAPTAVATLLIMGGSVPKQILHLVEQIMQLYPQAFKSLRAFYNTLPQDPKKAVMALAAYFSVYIAPLPQQLFMLLQSTDEELYKHNLNVSTASKLPRSKRSSYACTVPKAVVVIELQGALDSAKDRGDKAVATIFETLHTAACQKSFNFFTFRKSILSLLQTIDPERSVQYILELLEEKPQQYHQWEEALKKTWQRIAPSKSDLEKKIFSLLLTWYSEPSIHEADQMAVQLLTNFLINREVGGKKGLQKSIAFQKQCIALTEKMEHEPRTLSAQRIYFLLQSILLLQEGQGVQITAIEQSLPQEWEQEKYILQKAIKFCSLPPIVWSDLPTVYKSEKSILQLLQFAQDFMQQGQQVQPSTLATSQGVPTTFRLSKDDAIRFYLEMHREDRRTLEGKVPPLQEGRLPW